MTGYEIEYSMSALFWSPPPSSTLTVPTGGEDRWGVGGWHEWGGEDARGRRREEEIGGGEGGGER